MMNIEQSARLLSEQFGVDANAVNSLLSFLKSNAAKHAAQGIDVQTMSEEEKAKYIKEGVTAWNRQSQEFFTEMLANETERAQKYHADIAAYLHNKINANQAN